MLVATFETVEDFIANTSLAAEKVVLGLQRTHPFVPSEMIEDVVDESLEKWIAELKANKLLEPKIPYPWLLKTSSRALWVAVKKSRKVSHFEDGVEYPEFAVEDDSPNAIRDIKAFFSMLPERDRNLMELYHIEGYSLKEISEKTGDSVKNVSKRCRNAFRKLQRLAEIEKKLPDPPPARIMPTGAKIILNYFQNRRRISGVKTLLTSYIN